MKGAVGISPVKSVDFCEANSGRNLRHPNCVTLSCLIIELFHYKVVGRNMPLLMYLKIH